MRSPPILQSTRVRLSVSCVTFLFSFFFSFSLFPFFEREFSYGNMGITILPPVVEDIRRPSDEDGGVDMDMDVDVDVDVDMDQLPTKRPRLAKGPSARGSRSATGLVVPGESVTSDPQWMRLVSALSLAIAFDLIFVSLDPPSNYPIEAMAPLPPPTRHPSSLP